jgi:hypothetical protein
MSIQEPSTAGPRDASPMGGSSSDREAQAGVGGKGQIPSGGSGGGNLGQPKPYVTPGHLILAVVAIVIVWGALLLISASQKQYLAQQCNDAFKVYRGDTPGSTTPEFVKVQQEAIKKVVDECVRQGRSFAGASVEGDTGASGRAFFFRQFYFESGSPGYTFYKISLGALYAIVIAAFLVILAWLLGDILIGEKAVDTVLKWLEKLMGSAPGKSSSTAMGALMPMFVGLPVAAGAVAAFTFTSEPLQIAAQVRPATLEISPRMSPETLQSEIKIAVEPKTQDATANVNIQLDPKTIPIRVPVTLEGPKGAGPSISLACDKGTSACPASPDVAPVVDALRALNDTEKRRHESEEKRVELEKKRLAVESLRTKIDKQIGETLVNLSHRAVASVASQAASSTIELEPRFIYLSSEECKDMNAEGIGTCEPAEATRPAARASAR